MDNLIYKAVVSYPNPFYKLVYEDLPIQGAYEEVVIMIRFDEISRKYHHMELGTYELRVAFMEGK